MNGRRRLRVVLAGGVFPADTSVMAALAEKVDLVVYGSRHRFDWLTYEPSPPAVCRSRTFGRLVPTTRSAHMFWLYRGMGAALTADGPEVVHVVSEPWGLLSVQASTWARRHPQTVFTVHGCDRIWWHGSAPERAVRQLLARYSLARADAFAAESTAAADQALRTGLRAGALTASIHENPRDPSLFRPARDDAERAACRRALGLPVEGIGIGFLGRLVPEKGALVFLDAARELGGAAASPAWFALAGAGPDEQAVAARASSQGGYFLGELSYPEEVALFYRSVDVFVVPSYRTADWDDQSPRVVVEAMMSSCIVVGTRSGAIPQMVGDAGIVVAERDTGDLAAGLASAISLALDPGARERSRTRAIAHYSGGAVAERLLELWEQARELRVAA